MDEPLALGPFDQSILYALIKEATKTLPTDIGREDQRLSRLPSMMEKLIDLRALPFGLAPITDLIKEKSSRSDHSLYSLVRVIESRFNLRQIVRLADVVYAPRLFGDKRGHVSDGMEQVSLAGPWIADQDKNLLLSSLEALKEVKGLLLEISTFDLPIIVHVILVDRFDR
jgi:hypothetical protein